MYRVQCVCGMASLVCSGVLADESVNQCCSLSAEMCSTDNAANEQCTDSTLVELKVPVACTSAAELESLAAVSVDVSQCTRSSCKESCDLMSSLKLSLTASETDHQKRDLSLLSFPCVQSSSTPFSPQTPCSRFDSCILPLSDAVNCTCIVGAVLCRWDNIVGPRIVYVWTTTVDHRSWLAAKNILSYIARGTLAGEVNRSPHDEVKFFASSDSDVALATIVFSCHDDSDAPAMTDVSVYSMSVIIPYSELTTFLKMKSICLEWLSRAALHLRVLLSQVTEHQFW